MPPRRRPRSSPRSDLRPAAPTLVTVATYSSMVEAQISRAKLHAHGVGAFVTDEHLSTMNPQYLAAAGGIRLQVRPIDIPLAEEILREASDADADADADDDSEDGPRCPKCRSRYASYALLPLEILIAIFFLGLPFLFMKKAWSCGKCSHRWQAPEFGEGEKGHPYRTPRAGA